MAVNLRGVHFEPDSELEVVPRENDPSAQLTHAATTVIEETPHPNSPAESPKALKQRFQKLPEPLDQQEEEPVKKTNRCWDNCLAWMCQKCRR